MLVVGNERWAQSLGRPEPAKAAAPFRFTPPRSTFPPLIRRRLVAVLGERWEKRVVAVAAGAGFGKTTLLAQAIAENRLAPRGEDVWLGCQAVDSSAETLAEALAHALGATDGHDRDVTSIADAVWARVPASVAIVLDDVHLIEQGSTGAALLDELVAVLPENGHLVVAGRPPLPMALARWTAAGHVVHVTDDDLRFTSNEIDAFASLRGVATDRIAAVDGWPALSELAAIADADVREFLWEEVIGRLPQWRRDALAILATIGPVDDELASAAIGRSVAVEEIVAGLPMVSREAGWHTLHHLWREHLVTDRSPPLDQEARSRLVAALVERGDLERGFDILAGSQAWDDVGSIIRRACRGTHALVALDSLVRWRAAVPPDLEDEPEILLLDAAVLKASRFEEAAPPLQAAAEKFRDRGDSAGEVMCLSQLAHIWQESWAMGEVFAVTTRATELEAEGVADAVPLASIGRALLAIASGDPRAALVELDRAASVGTHPEVVALVDWYASMQHFALGDAEAALERAQRSLRRATGMLRPVVLDAIRLSLLQLAKPDEAIEAGRAAEKALELAGAARNKAITHGHSALVAAVLGDADSARHHLAVTMSHHPEVQGTYATTVASAAEALILLLDGDEKLASERLAAELEARPVGTAMLDGAHRAAAAWIYLLVPEQRALVDALPLSPLQTAGLELARALVDAREHDSLALVRALQWPPVELVRTRLPFPWAVELAVCGIAAGQSAARSLLDALGDQAIPWVRSLRESSSSSIARTARDLAASLPVVPAYQTSIDVLGPLRVRRDGAEIDDAALRRERVRALLGYLITHPTTSRDAVVAALWPDLDPAAGLNNLRVNLNHLMRILEPAREPGAPSFFVRQPGPAIRFGGGDKLIVDAWRFEEHLRAAEAASRDGVPSAALDELLDAIGLFGGQYLEDAGLEWAETERERLRSRFVDASVRAADLLVAGGDPARAAQIAARAVDADEWSEAARRALASAYLAGGDRGAALRTLQHCDEVLAELGVEPAPATTALRQRVLTSG